MQKFSAAALAALAAGCGLLPTAACPPAAVECPPASVTAAALRECRTPDLGPLRAQALEAATGYRLEWLVCRRALEAVEAARAKCAP